MEHREKIITNILQNIQTLTIYEVSNFLFNFILACTWLRVVCGSFLLSVEHGFSQRCGWEGNKTECYIQLWEKISRSYMPYVAFIQGATSLDCFVRRVRRARTTCNLYELHPRHNRYNGQDTASSIQNKSFNDV